MIDLIGKEILLESCKSVFEKVLDKGNKGYFNTIEKNTELPEALTSEIIGLGLKEPL